MILLRTRAVTRVLLVRPGSTEFDDQGRIKGSMDMPLSPKGQQQADSLARELGSVDVQTIYTAACQSAQETASRIASGRNVKIKVIECFRNIDHGLWHGKLIDEVRRNQPRVYRCGQESPAEVCPPGGESIRDAKARVLKGFRKLTRKGADGVVAMVIPDPLASLVESELRGVELGDLWKAERDAAQWTLIDVKQA